MLGLNSKVNYQGRITTIAELAAEGKVTFKAEEHYGKYDKPAYFADTGEDNGWQISKLAYAKGVNQYPAGIESKANVTLQPYTFAEKQAALVAKLAGSGVEWLADVDFENWEVAYEWLMASPWHQIFYFAPVIESGHWNGTFPVLETGS